MRVLKDGHCVRQYLHEVYLVLRHGYGIISNSLFCVSERAYLVIHARTSSEFKASISMPY